LKKIEAAPSRRELLSNRRSLESTLHNSMFLININLTITTLATEYYDYIDIEIIIIIKQFLFLSCF